VHSFWSTIDNERLSIWNGSFATAGFSIVGGFIVMYLLDGLHATDSQMGLFNALPSLLNLFAMIAAAWAIQYARSKKKFCYTATTISRSFYLWIAIVPFLPFHNQALIVIVLWALRSFVQSFGDLSWQAMIGDLIAPERRANFFSERNRIITIVGLVVTFATGLLLQQFDIHALRPYQWVFIVTIGMSFMEIYTLKLHRELPAFERVRNETSPSQSLSQKFLPRIRFQRTFIHSALTMLFFNFGWQVAWPLFNIYQINTAHAPAFWNGMFTVANQASQILTYKWWGRMSERYGTLRMLAFAAIGMGFAPILTIVSTNMYYLFITNIFTGIPVAGTLLLLFNHLLEVIPENERTRYIASYNVGLSVVGFIAPEVGIWLLSSLGMTGGMWVSTVLRIAGGGLFFWVALRTVKRTRAADSALQVHL